MLNSVCLPQEKKGNRNHSTFTDYMVKQIKCKSKLNRAQRHGKKHEHRVISLQKKGDMRNERCKLAMMISIISNISFSFIFLNSKLFFLIESYMFFDVFKIYFKNSLI